MKILIDTHILIWMLQDSPCLSRKVRDVFADPETELYYSSVSIAEISVKHKVHPEEMPLTGEEAAECVRCLAARVESTGYKIVVSRGDHITKEGLYHANQSHPNPRTDHKAI